jgi:hypothetical protein
MFMAASYHRSGTPPPGGVAGSLGALVLLGTAIAVTCSSLVIAVARPEDWARLGREDGPVEIASAVACLLLSVVAARRFLRSPRGARAPSAALAILGVVGAGEEISWGQRIFGIESPPFFASHNVQGETNLHNLLPPPWDGILAAVLLLGFCSSPLWRQRSWARELVRRGVAWPRPVHVAVLAGCVIAGLVVAGVTGARELEEVAELDVVLTLAAVWYSDEG